MKYAPIIALLIAGCAEQEPAPIERAACDTLRIEGRTWVPDDRAGWRDVSGHTLEYREPNLNP